MQNKANEKQTCEQPFFAKTRRLLNTALSPHKGISAQSCGHCTVGGRNRQEWRQDAATALKEGCLWRWETHSEVQCQSPVCVPGCTGALTAAEEGRGCLRPSWVLSGEVAGRSTWKHSHISANSWSLLQQRRGPLRKLPQLLCLLAEEM